MPDLTYTCIFCLGRRIFSGDLDLRKQAKTKHLQRLSPQDTSRSWSRTLCLNWHRKFIPSSGHFPRQTWPPWPSCRNLSWSLADLRKTVQRGKPSVNEANISSTIIEHASNIATNRSRKFGEYAGLVIVEAKRIEVDSQQATLAQIRPRAQLKLNNEQWQTLIALHRTLLHEHHGFL
jgi:hypothetical protein